jgi:NADH-quinone oxidoreductase subunit G
VQEIAALISPTATMEEAFLLQKFMRSLGSNNIDHRLRVTDFSAQEQHPTYPSLGIKFSQIEQQSTIILIGSNLHKELPIAGVKFVKAAKNGCNIIVINPCKFKFNFKCTQEIVTKNEYALELASILKALKIEHPLTKSVTVNSQHQAIAKILKDSQSGLIVLGHLAQMDPHVSQIVSLANLLASKTKLTFGNFNLGANDAAHWLAGAVPHRLPGGIALTQSGKNAQQMLTKPSKAYILFGLEPEVDSAFGLHALNTIKEADFVLTISPYVSENLLNISDVILPCVPFSETDGTYVNLDGVWQSNVAAVQPFGEARPGWKILRVLGNKAGICDFEYQKINDITEEIKAELTAANNTRSAWQDINIAALYQAPSVSLTTYIPLYMTDNVVRRAKALQKTKDAETVAKVKMHGDTAKRHQVHLATTILLKTDTGQAKLALEIDNNVSPDVLLVPLNQHTVTLGYPWQSLEILPCNG